MKKRILPLALALTLTLSLAVPAMAAEAVTLTGSLVERATSVTITGVLSQENTSFTLKHLSRAVDENGNLVGKAQILQEEKVSDVTIYTLSGDFTANATDSYGTYDERAYGAYEGYKLSQDGTYETIGRAFYGEYGIFDFTATSDEKAFQQVTQEEFFAQCDLIRLDALDPPVWIRFADGAQGTPAEPEQPTVPTVAPSPCKGSIDGMMLTLNAYLFTEGNAGSNYVMLRDVAQLLNGTKAQFEVTWDKDKGIVITTGKAYTPVGGELQGKGDGSKPYTANASTITIDGKAVELSAYTIEGNNYFKLRDLGAALGFNVSWDKDAGVIIDSSGPILWHKLTAG